MQKPNAFDLPAAGDVFYMEGAFYIDVDLIKQNTDFVQSTLGDLYRFVSPN